MYNVFTVPEKPHGVSDPNVVNHWRLGASTEYTSSDYSPRDATITSENDRCWCAFPDYSYQQWLAINLTEVLQRNNVVLEFKSCPYGSLREYQVRYSTLDKWKEINRVSVSQIVCNV